MSDDKKKRGRPKKKFLNKKYSHVAIRLTAIEHDRLKLAANAEDLSVSEFIRSYMNDILHPKV